MKDICLHVDIHIFLALYSWRQEAASSTPGSSSLDGEIACLHSVSTIYSFVFILCPFSGNCISWLLVSWLPWVCACELSHFSHVWLFATLWNVARQAPLSMDSPGKNIGVVCHALLQGILAILASNPHVLHFLHLAGRFFNTSTTLDHWFPYKMQNWSSYAHLIDEETDVK